MNCSKQLDQNSLSEVIKKLPRKSVVAITGSGGGLMEPDAVLQVFERCFNEFGSPSNLTLVHALGLGDGDCKGTNRFAHEGMVDRVIGGHWTWSPRMLELVRESKIEAYALPSGVIVHLLREIGAGRPGLITKVGIGTYVDPRNGGGKSSASAVEDLVELVELGGEEYLRYLPFPVSVAVVKGTFCDEFGNIYSTEEAADLDGYELALAASNSGGIVIAQVREYRSSDQLRAREVLIPGQLVDHILVEPEQQQTYRGGYDLAYAGLGSKQRTVESKPHSFADPARNIVAERAAQEVKDKSILNFGFGMSSDVSGVLQRSGKHLDYWVTVEQGLHNGSLLGDALFGISDNPSAIVSSAQQFDFYSGAGLDQTFLGMGEFDGDGNVNVSHLGERLSGPGGFIDISQGAKHVVFCGRFNAKGTSLAIQNHGLVIEREGTRPKAVKNVRAITFSGIQANVRGQKVTYVTERAVFELTTNGVELIEYAPGLDIKRDILERMEFQPIVNAPREMNLSCFTAPIEQEKSLA